MITKGIGYPIGTASHRTLGFVFYSLVGLDVLISRTFRHEKFTVAPTLSFLRHSRHKRWSDRYGASGTRSGSRIGTDRPAQPSPTQGILTVVSWVSGVTKSIHRQGPNARRSHRMDGMLRCQ